MRLVVLVVAAVAALAAAGAEANTVRATRTYVVIAASPETADAAQGIVASLPLPASLALGPGYPRVAESASLPGLKPGFHVVLLGHCVDHADADVARDLVLLDVAGAYTREVVMDAPAGACPRVVEKSPAPGTHGKPRLTRVDEGVRTVSWAVARRDEVKGKRCASTRVQVLVNKLVVDEVVFDDDKCHADETATYFTVGPPVELGPRRLLPVHKRVDWVDNGETTSSLWGFACGRLHELGPVGTSQYPPVAHDVTAAGPPGAPWRVLVVKDRAEDPTQAALVEPQPRTLTWDPARCAYLEARNPP